MHIATIYEYVKAAWALRIRRQYGTDTVVTEFGFPPPQGKFNLRAPVRRSLRNINMVMTALLLGLLAPGAFLYVTVMREPVKRLISNFFWRYRRFFSGQHEPRLPVGGFPDFGEFADKQVLVYMLSLKNMPAHTSDAGP